MKSRKGLFGGSFDPVHHGHLIAARTMAELFRLDQVYLIPAAQPPHKPDILLAPPEHRMEMLRLAIEGDPLFEICDDELARRGPSYSIDTVEAFRQRYGETAELFWIIGADALPELPTWRRVGELVQRVRIITAARTACQSPDHARLASAVGSVAADQLLADAVPTPMIDISASVIRKRIAADRPVRYLVPRSVEKYIQSNSLYRT